MRDRDAKLARIAERQFGTFSGAQAVAAGYPRRTIQERVRSGLWIPVIADTYRVAGAAEVWQQPILGAYLAVGQPCAVSGLAARAVWRIGGPPDRVEVVVPWTRRPRTSGIDVVRTRRWSRSEIVRYGTMHVTSMHRTLLDLVPRLHEAEFERCLDAAHRRGLDLRSFTEYLCAARSNKVPGASNLSSLVATRDPDRPIETDAETLLFRTLRLGGLPLPVPQYWVQTRTGRKRLDFAYPEQRVAIEFDSYEWHGDRRSFDDDRARDNELADLGWERRHITWTMLTVDPAEVLWTIGRALHLTPRTWQPDVALA